ncbi:Uncharacterised protein [Mycobacterium tuberculosis]|uniref:Uncharacterized protein n=1 Tax=Mycobacterium tuberculosis TaxID=1773 RepID=A0A655DR59_MYCTX|nr:Uncharacterised protein [Mycobacterium tuberculosis]CKP50044.1 Uncharacterised protein [Mycobacterium tuberculosis]CKR44556.1 Uncharacterised protein [Mycobacterium tuberculosis]CKS39425.1 Uncharacterised protein [Mycobacterium tuberculosis]CKS91701.1 Uncharacterised protein [Mycobacterium tuberculosis]
MNARNTERIEINNIKNAITATKTSTSGCVADTRSSKSLIRAVGPPTSTCAAPATRGSWVRIQVMVSRAPKSSGSTDSTALSKALPLSSANRGGATETTLGACAIR